MKRSAIDRFSDSRRQRDTRRRKKAGRKSIHFECHKDWQFKNDHEIVRAFHALMYRVFSGLNAALLNDLREHVNKCEKDFPNVSDIDVVAGDTRNKMIDIVQQHIGPWIKETAYARESQPLVLPRDEQVVTRDAVQRETRRIFDMAVRFGRSRRLAS